MHPSSREILQCFSTATGSNKTTQLNAIPCHAMTKFSQLWIQHDLESTVIDHFGCQIVFDIARKPYEVPQTGPSLATRNSLQQISTVTPYCDDGLCDFRNLWTLLLLRDRFLRALPHGAAARPDGAFATTRIIWRAHRRAQIHQSLVEFSGRFAC